VGCFNGVTSASILWAVEVFGSALGFSWVMCVELYHERRSGMEQQGSRVNKRRAVTKASELLLFEED